MRHLIFFVFVLLLSLFAVLPFFQNGYFPMHDDTQVQRVQQMAKSLSDGMFPVRMVSDLGYGYGYPIFNFYAPFAYYVGGVVALLGQNVLVATKAMMIIGILLSGISMYVLARAFFGEKGAMVASALYVYAPYHAVNIYVRGAVGEYFAYAFMPLIFYAIWGILEKKQFRFVVISSIAYGLTILSHNLTAFIITPFILLALSIGLFVAIKKKEQKQMLFLILPLLLGALLSAFYWLPALLEMQYTNVASQIGKGAYFADHFVCLSQLWESMWGFGGSTRGCVDGLSFRIGKLHILLGLFSLLGFFLYRRDTKNLIVLSFSWITLIFGVFFMMPLSSSIWNMLPAMAYIQYPWRFLSIVCLFVSFLGGFGSWILLQQIEKYDFFKKNSWIFVLLALAGILFVNAKLFEPKLLNTKHPADFISQNILRFTVSKISDEYMPAGFQKPQNIDQTPKGKFSVSAGNARIEVIENKTQTQQAIIYAAEPSKILIHTAYFPAWILEDNNQKISYQIEKNGLAFSLKKGKHVIRLTFEQTQVERLGNLLSIIGFCLLIVGIIVTKKRGIL